MSTESSSPPGPMSTTSRDVGPIKRKITKTKAKTTAKRKVAAKRKSSATSSRKKSKKR